MLTSQVEELEQICSITTISPPPARPAMNAHNMPNSHRPSRCPCRRSRVQFATPLVTAVHTNTNTHLLTQSDLYFTRTEIKLFKMRSNADGHLPLRRVEEWKVEHMNTETAATVYELTPSIKPAPISPLPTPPPCQEFCPALLEARQLTACDHQVRHAVHRSAVKGWGFLWLHPLVCLRHYVHLKSQDGRQPVYSE